MIRMLAMATREDIVSNKSKFHKKIGIKTRKYKFFMLYLTINMIYLFHSALLSY